MAGEGIELVHISAGLRLGRKAAYHHVDVFCQASDKRNDAIIDATGFLSMKT
jgi:hypothetical protein